MAKKGVYKISGNTAPKVLEKTFYNVDEWYPATPNLDRNLSKVTWELFVKEDDGFRTTNIKKKGINHFTFNKDAYKYTYKIEGYLHEPEGNSPMSIIVQPQKNENSAPSKQKDILGVSLTYEDGAKISKALSYRDRLKATAKCEGLEGEKVVFTLWEDDEKGKGHNKNNQFITKSPPVEVNKYGKAGYVFTLSSTFISLANKRENDKKQHEFYVTVEYNGRLDASQNVNVNNPEAQKTKPLPTPAASKPQPKKETAKFPSSATSPKKQSDPKGKILSAEFVDGRGNKISSAKIGNTVSIKITSQNMKDKIVTVRIWEDDTFNDDLLFEKKVRITSDEALIKNVTLTKSMYEKGKAWEVEGNLQEFYIEIEHLSVSTESTRIEVGLNEEPKKIEALVSTTQVEKKVVSKKEENTKKGECFCNRDFEANEFEKIIHGLRDSEPRVKKDSGYNLFEASNCNIKLEDKTIDKLRTEFNNIFTNYNINTCLRKLHFIAQIYHETDRLRTAKEYADGIKYDPGKHKDAISSGNIEEGDGEKYKGRGLMQLTWKNNYKIYKYYSGIDVITRYQTVSDNLHNACDSAGWYWKEGKILSVGKRWRGPADPPIYVKIHEPDYPKTTISWQDGTAKKQYGTVDLGLIADDDKVDLISYLVNGGANGLNERRNYVNTLKIIFEYPQKCVNKKTAQHQNNQSFSESVTIRLVRKWQTQKSTIGEFTIDNTRIKGFFLEEKGPDTTVSGNEQRVPIGTYNLEWHSGTKIKKGLKLFNDVVSKDRAILIHSGNTADDTEGCLIAGSTKSVDFVGGSRNKLKEIFDYVEEIGIKDAKIIITQAYE